MQKCQVGQIDRLASGLCAQQMRRADGDVALRHQQLRFQHRPFAVAEADGAIENAALCQAVF
ncbi:hypothetical protein D9M72_636200 [compost metagenome]